MDRIRVMWIIARLNIGGPASHVVDLAAGLDPERYDTLLVTGKREATEGDMSYLAADAGVPVHTLHHLRREIRPWSDLIAQIDLIRLMRSWKPQIVHTHTFKAGALGRLAAWYVRIPVVLHTFHGHTFHGYWSTFGSKIAVLLERLLARVTTGIVTISERLKRDLLHYEISAADEIHIIPLGLNLQPFLECGKRRGELRAVLGLNATDQLIGIVGRLVPIKNHQLFLEAAHRMVKNGFSGQFIIVGDGELSEQLLQAALEKGLADRVHFMGWQRDLGRIYADLDVLVNSSLNEGTPVAAIEAMAAGVPVVATAVGGVPDMIEERATGYLVPSGDAAAMAAAIEYALENGAEVRAAAQREAQVRYSLEGLLVRVAALYELLLPEAWKQKVTT